MAECIRFDYPLPEDDRIHRIWNQISAIRHEVYADELQQYDSNPDGKIEDPGRHFIATVEGDDLVGYISLNPPGGRPFRLTTYFSDDVLDRTVFARCDDPAKTTFEVRGLTVGSAHRGQNHAFRLMRHALEFVVEQGGTDIVAMGHTGVVSLYENNGMKVFHDDAIQHGETVYFPMHMKVSAILASHAEKIQADRDDESGDDACYHGGQSWEASKFDFDVRDSLIVADVLDSPFPPCPEALEVIRDQLERCCQESPPTQCEELIETIAEVRGVPVRNVAVSSGSSSLMFSLLPQLLDERSRVLLLSPMYGEYSHILQHVIGCHITYFVLEDANGFAIDADDLISQAREHDAVILVNPNSPTGVYCESMADIVSSIARSNNPGSQCKMIWVDETYINYLPDAVSLEPLCGSLPELVVCKHEQVLCPLWVEGGLRRQSEHGDASPFHSPMGREPSGSTRGRGCLAQRCLLRSAVRGDSQRAEEDATGAGRPRLPGVFRRGQLSADVPSSGVGLLVHPFHRSLQRTRPVRARRTKHGRSVAQQRCSVRCAFAGGKRKNAEHR